MSPLGREARRGRGGFPSWCSLDRFPGSPNGGGGFGACEPKALAREIVGAGRETARWYWLWTLAVEVIKALESYRPSQHNSKDDSKSLHDHSALKVSAD